MKVKVKSLSCVRLFESPWIVAYQAPLSMGFPRQKYWSRLPFPSPGDLPDLGIEPVSSAWQAYSLPMSHLRNPSNSINVVLKKTCAPKGYILSSTKIIKTSAHFQNHSKSLSRNILSKMKQTMVARVCTIMLGLG